jgi:hypothetical protein
MAHEDDVPEVRAVVHEAVSSLPPPSRRLLGVLAASRGDFVRKASLLEIARLGARGPGALDAARALRLVQEPAPDCFTLHATVRTALEGAVRFDASKVALHYLQRFERSPADIAADPTQLFALMDWAQEERRIDAIVRVTALAEKLVEIAPEPSATRRS